MDEVTGFSFLEASVPKKIQQKYSTNKVQPKVIDSKKKRKTKYIDDETILAAVNSKSQGSLKSTIADINKNGGMLYEQDLTRKPYQRFTPT